MGLLCLVLADFPKNLKVLAGAKARLDTFKWKGRIKRGGASSPSYKVEWFLCLEGYLYVIIKTNPRVGTPNAVFPSSIRYDPT